MQHSSYHSETYGRPTTVLSNGRYVLLNQIGNYKYTDNKLRKEHGYAIRLFY